MKKLILIGALMVVSSVAVAQPSQSQGGAQAGTNGTVDTTKTSPIGTMPSERQDVGTTGIGNAPMNGNAGVNDGRPVETTGPAGQMPKSAAPTR